MKKKVNRLKVEIWSDFVCPFCYIGKRKFDQGLKPFPHHEQVEMVFRSFELNPYSNRDGNPHVHEMLIAKYNMSREQAIASTRNLTEQARAVGLHYNLEQTIQTNTFDAHRLAHYAATQGKLTEMTERLMEAHLVEGLHIGHHDVLLHLAVEVGLSSEEGLQVLSEGQFSEEVRTDEQEASRIGVQGVPFFVIDQKYAVMGAQSSEVFTKILQQAWDEAHSTTKK
jgi:predicted DsbA family dithiol-disulfide isomerase